MTPRRRVTPPWTVEEGGVYFISPSLAFRSWDSLRSERISWSQNADLDQYGRNYLFETVPTFGLRGRDTIYILIARPGTAGRRSAYLLKKSLSKRLLPL